LDSGGLLLEFRAVKIDDPLVSDIGNREGATIVGSLTRIVSEGPGGDVGLSLTDVRRFRASTIEDWQHGIPGLACGRWLLRVEVEDPDIDRLILLLNQVCDVEAGTTKRIALQRCANAEWIPMFVEDSGYLGGFTYYFRPFGQQSWWELKTPEANVLFAANTYAPGHYQLFVPGADVQTILLEPRETREDRIFIKRRGDSTSVLIERVAG